MMIYEFMAGHLWWVEPDQIDVNSRKIQGTFLSQGRAQEFTLGGAKYNWFSFIKCKLVFI